MTSKELLNQSGQHMTSSDDDAGFVALLSAYRSTGGLVRGEDVAGHLTRQGGDGYVHLARLIVAGDVLHIRWSGHVWLPLFQFNRPALDVRPDVLKVLSELRTVMDACELMLWFVTPNAWMGGRKPVEMVNVSPCELYGAARADRFISRG
ncbi:hypothetical protein J2W30_006205 [Variovorax boronicumulans]|uniref:hypothetical protein n=1 Tax=Variovorax boronicumulans TaxID=436515 RepID=UPI00278463DA|nr:hypothetical protein [Variovorax boronicumulans]MDP9995214.1 hypothetical protein [Variovorax boronicumulans]MDQ0006504.1 hypothetical protein [Variovorax boronicumulans]MDQ0038418.1 hypothetical protein [Variovorax boronicumulans]